jgi:ABC-type iron transport system FetAB permease component
LSYPKLSFKHMKLSRLYQPRNPRFWMMILVNILSYILAWVLRSYSLLPLAAVVIAVFALGNAFIGIRLALDLMRDDTPS